MSCKPSNTAGEGYKSAQYFGGMLERDSVKWGEYSCDCGTGDDKKIFKFIGPGQAFDKTNLLGVNESILNDVGRGGVMQQISRQEITWFSLDPNSKFDQWRYPTLIDSFRTNNRIGGK